jgi:hypothetical protein
MIKWIKNLIKKNKEEMISEDQLISYKQNFTGQKFQWIKTNRPELLGKIVRCRDVQPTDNSAIAIFEDGSKIDVKRLNSDLMMIVGDMQPLSREEVESISGRSSFSSPPPPPPPPPPAGPTGSGPIEIPDELKDYQSTNQTQPEAKPRPPFNPSVKPEPVKNPFEMFNSDYTELILKMNVKIPDKKLLKMMYTNAENKDEFMNQLASYIYSMINNNTVVESLESIFVVQSKTKPTSSKPGTPTEEIKLTEVDD